MGITRLTAIALVALALSTLGAAHAPKVNVSRLERDFAVQKRLLQADGFEYGEACGGPPWVTVYRSGGEIRKIECDVEMSFGGKRLEFYFSRGKPQLVIEHRTPKLDENGEGRKVLQEDPPKRLWLTERCTGARAEAQACIANKLQT